MLFQYPLHHRQAEAGAASHAFCGEERLVHAALHIVGNTRAGVGHRQADVFAGFGIGVLLIVAIDRHFPRIER